ncbi:nuclear condensing complex subunit [Cytidiella melzeri]|nr:nuclear condensing complex subunit [Cytidiella melzeri]
MALEALFREVSAIFDQVQVSTANHRKNSVSLLKIHTKSVASVQKLTDRTQRPVGERRFTKVFVDMLGRVLVVKKGVLPADRVMKFVGAYVAYISDKGPSSTDEEDSETPVSRFVAQLLKFLLQGFEAKDKSVRFRSVGTVAELIAHLGELDEDVYEELRHALLERMRDKEAAIRSQAVLALTKLMGSDTNGIDAEIDEESILGNILYSLCSDSASEVRRLALASIPLMPSTLPIILTRTRDVDPCIRSLVFSKALFHFNPAQLTIAQRETLVRDGLGDRDDKVKAAAAELVDGWFALARGDGASDFIADAMQFLKLFDLTSEDGISIATDALRSIFATRASVVSKVTFSDDYWRALTPEAAVFARCFIEYTSPNSVDASCSGIGINTSCVMENSTIPVVTAFAYYVQEACNRMLDTIEELEIIKLRGNDGETDSDDEENVLALEECEELLVQGICVFSELLKIACCLDYSDEIGRRKMFLVIRTIIGVEYLPESLIDTCVEVLKATTDEREMIKVTVEVMVELRDSLFEGQEEDDDEASESEVEVTRSRTINNSKLGTQKRPTREWTRQEKLRADEIDLRCLSLCIAMMKRVNGQFHEHSVLEGIVSDLIIPSITRDQASHRELGLVALGLCSLTSKDMALQSFPLFCNQSQHASEGLKTKVLQIVLDLLLMHCSAFFQRSKETTEQILSFLLQTFEQEESSSVRATICVGLSKLMLNGIVTDERALAALVLAFVSPANSGNQELRQCLSCFIPAYCYSSYANQCRMQSIFFIVFELITQVYDELEPGQSMITPIQFCTLFLDWTDPQRRASGSSARPGSEDIHLNLAIDILKACYDDDRTSQYPQAHLAVLMCKI